MFAQVATLEDPATARLGESLYAFLPRTLAGNLRDGYAAEARRLAAKGQPLLSVHNQCAAPSMAVKAAVFCCFSFEDRLRNEVCIVCSQ